MKCLKWVQYLFWHKAHNVGTKKLHKLDDSKKLSILKRGIGIEKVYYTSDRSLLKKEHEQVKIKRYGDKDIDY